MNAPSNLAARYATLADAPAIAALHSASWRDAYAPLLAPHRLPDTLEAEHLAMWTATIPQVAPGRLLVVEADGTEILAFLSTVPDPDGDAAAEHLAALHVAPGAQGMGLGALLLSGVAANCHAEGRQRLWCWVLTGNAGARAFYARLGGTEAAAQRVALTAGAEADHVPVIFADLAALAWTAAAAAARAEGRRRVWAAARAQDAATGTPQD